VVTRVRRSLRIRIKRLNEKRWQILQCAVAAGLAWLLAERLLGHSHPVFAPIAAVVSLGTAYGKRLRRIAEVTLGVSIGVLLSDVLLQVMGSGSWQLAVMVALAFSIALLLDASTVFVNQAAVQSIFVVGMVATTGIVWTRWLDGLLGGAVALVVAAVAPAAPLRRPRERAADVMRRIAVLLRAAADVMESGQGEQGFKVLADARATDRLIRELQTAADEGMGIAVSSPFYGRHRPSLQKLADLVEPLDRALRSTRVLVRQVAVAAHRGRPLPSSYPPLARQLADACDLVASELDVGKLAEDALAAIQAVGAASGAVERTDVISADAILVQLRSIVVDLLVVAGLDQMMATDTLPPVEDV
jgi:uncharacterized membrane protein YgaE (UPF0421/DUF939 family)